MSDSKRFSAAIALLYFLFAGLALPQNQAEMARLKAEADALYQQARLLLDQKRWTEAVASFEQLAEKGQERADAALYWKSYAQAQQELRSQALETLQELKTSYPQSRWLHDAKALELQLRQAAGLPVTPEGENDEDLKLIAINSLLHADSEKAIPLLEKILQGNQSTRLKKKALFVLAQSDSPQAREATARAARELANPDLQSEAIQYLGVFGSPENLALLSEIYASSTDVPLKKKILHGFMVAGQRDRILQAAEKEPDPELRRQGVHLLGVMGAREDLWRLYQGESSDAVKKRIMEALFIAGDHEHMAQLAKTEQNPGLRAGAIEKLGLMGTQTASQLSAIYADNNDQRTRRAVLQAFFLQGNAQALIEIARKEKDPRMKRDAVQKLSLMGSPEAREFMLELLNQ